jgi:methylthioribose-1-phosphate isomerase
MPPSTLTWIGDGGGYLRIIDQSLLPTELAYRDLRTVDEVWEAIRTLRVRGAPAIGVTAAYGVVLGVSRGGPEQMEATCDYLATARPTAVNLFWALERMRRAGGTPQALLAEARAIEAEDRRTCQAIGEVGAALIAENAGVLTHCNAGALATVDHGTALAPLFLAAEAGRRFHVFVDETRPLLQGARLTAWELSQRHIALTLICDSMAAQVMKEGKVQVAIVGADRIAANGDTANKIGTYGVAVLAQAHGIPFYVAAPSSTFDLSLANGEAIPIEQRPATEITHGFGKQTAPDGVAVYNPAFDVTPARLIAGIITEKGLVRPVTTNGIREVLGRSFAGPVTRGSVPR